jgi:hypothetical protein
MANGKRGDNPVTDMLLHGLHPFPADIEVMLREVFALDPIFPDGKRRWLEQLEWLDRFNAWARGEQIDEGRAALERILLDLRANRGT